MPAIENHKRERPARIFIPFFSLWIISVLAILVFLFNTAREIDDVATQASINIVSSVIRINEQEVSTHIKDYAWWDEAINNLLLNHDREWSGNNIDLNVLENFGLSGMIAVNHTLSPVHVIQDDRGIDEHAIPALIEKLNPLIEAALQASMSEPVAQNGMTLIGATPHIVSVSALTPVGPPLHGYGPENRGLLIGWRPLDQAFLDQMTKNFGLINPIFSTVAISDYPAALPLVDIDGSDLGCIKWDTTRLGKEYLLSSLWIIALLLSLIVGASAILYRRLALLWAHANDNAELNRRLVTDLREEVRKHERTEDQLKAEESRKAAIFDSALDGIISIDATGRIIDFNPAAAKIFGAEPADVTGRELAELFNPQELTTARRGALSRNFKNVEKRNLGELVKMPAIRADGTEITVEMSISEYRLGGETAYTTFVRDVTERMRADKLKDEFVSTVSHELRTPLTSIMGSLGLLKAGKLGEVSEQAAAMIDVAARNSERLVRLTNDILDIEKFESGALEMRQEPVHVVPLVKEAITLNQSYAEEHQVTFELSQANPDAVVIADSDRLIQVVTNLLSNAAKFSPSGSTVEISVKATENFARVSVRDQGLGIPAELRPRLFEKFVQADASASRSRGGTGLGLSISRAIIELLDGRIDFESIPGEGTVFFFELPLRQHESAGGG